MRHRNSMVYRLLAPIFASSLMPVGLTVAALVLAPVEARAEVTSAECQIHAVLATKSGDGTIPADLGFLAEQLRDDQFAAFKGFRLLESKSLKLNIGEPGSATMKSGHQLKLSLLGAEASKLRLHATLASGEKVLVVSNTSGARLETYTIAGPRGSGGICVNGAAAHRIGPEIGALDFVSHCYLRPRAEGWPYNLFAMVHARSRDDVGALVEAISGVLGEALRSHDVLFSSRILKKTGLRIRD